MLTLSDSLTIVKARRYRFILGWVITRKDRALETSFIKPLLCWHGREISQTTNQNSPASNLIYSSSIDACGPIFSLFGVTGKPIALPIIAERILCIKCNDSHLVNGIEFLQWFQVLDTGTKTACSSAIRFNHVTLEFNMEKTSFLHGSRWWNMSGALS